jgi:hypothetical protein
MSDYHPLAREIAELCDRDWKPGPHLQNGIAQVLSTWAASRDAESPAWVRGHIAGWEERLAKEKGVLP